MLKVSDIAADYCTFTASPVPLIRKQIGNCLTLAISRVEWWGWEARTPDLRFGILMDLPNWFVFNLFSLVSLLPWA
jgi:hypothetical protein